MSYFRGLLLTTRLEAYLHRNKKSSFGKYRVTRTYPDLFSAPTPLLPSPWSVLVVSVAVCLKPGGAEPGNRSCLRVLVRIAGVQDLFNK